MSVGHHIPKQAVDHEQVLPTIQSLSTAMMETIAAHGGMQDMGVHISGRVLDSQSEAGGAKRALEDGDSQCNSGKRIGDSNHGAVNTRNTKRQRLV